MTIAQLDTRGETYIRASISYDDAVQSHSVYVARTLDDAYGAFNGVPGAGPQLIGTAFRGSGMHFASKSRKGKQAYVPNNPSSPRSRFEWSPSDYDNTTYPTNAELTFSRVTADGAAPVAQGPISMIPPFGWASVGRPALSLYGTAPVIATAVPGRVAPTQAMHLKFPAHADSILLKNHGGGDLLVSVGEGLPLLRVEAGDTLNHTSGMSDNLFICSAAGNHEFSLLVGAVMTAR